MANENDRKESEHLPTSVTEFIEQLLKKMRYRRKIREEVGAELTAHFEDELRDCAGDTQKQDRAKRLITEFGDAKLLGILMRRAKKRCRPLWQKVLVRSLQVLGICVLYLFVCSLPLLIGKPTLSVDYVEWLNDFVQDGRDEADNARPYYEKAGELNVEMPEWLAENMSSWPSDFNDVDLKLLADWLKQNQETIEKLTEGAGRAGCWARYRADATKLDRDLVANAMEILPRYRKLARTMRWHIRYQACAGNIEAAMNDSVALVKFGCHLQGHGLLIEQLVGISIEALAHHEIFIIMERMDVSADILKNTYDQLEKQFAGQRAVLSLEAEKVFWYDGIQRGFTDDGQGNGRVLAYGLRYIAGGDFLDSLWTFATFNLPDRKELVTAIDQYFAGYADALEKTPWELRNESMDNQQTNPQVKIAPLLLEIVAPAYGRVNVLSWRLKTDREALLTTLALVRFEKNKGLLPMELYELVEAGYLKQLPMDAFSGRTLTYRKTADNFKLYSFGPDFKDDGGLSGTGRSGQAKQWMEDGDTVFWPVSAQQVKPRQ